MLPRGLLVSTFELPSSGSMATLTFPFPTAGSAISSDATSAASPVATRVSANTSLEKTSMAFWVSPDGLVAESRPDLNGMLSQTVMLALAMAAVSGDSSSGALRRRNSSSFNLVRVRFLFHLGVWRGSAMEGRAG